MDILMIAKLVTLALEEVRALRRETATVAGTEPIPDWPRLADGRIDFDAALKIPSAMDEAGKPPK